MTRLVFCLAVALLAPTAIFLATAERLPKADFTYVNPSGIHTLDPARMSWSQDFRVALNIWEGLTSWDPKTLEPLPAAARSISPSDDGLSYTFILRDDGRWSNGDRVTAQDFVRGWRRGLEPGTAADYAFLLTNNIQGAKAYADWRRGGVAKLTALHRLGDGWTLRREQARVLVQSGVFADIRSHLVRAGATVPTAAQIEEGSVRLSELMPASKWRALHQTQHQRHAREMGDRFRGVGVRAVDEITLEVQLQRPCPYFLDLLALPVFLPCHQSIERMRERYNNTALTPEGLVAYDSQWTKPSISRNGYAGLITNGPYHMTKWTFKRRARLVVNPYHRNAGTISCKSIDMLVMENISAALMAYENGSVDFLPAMDVPYEHELARLARSGERPDFHLAVTLSTFFFNFNCNSPTIDGHRNPFVNARVRQAFALAIDKNKIVQGAIGRGDRVAESLVPRGDIPGYHPPNGRRVDLPRARQLLSDAGFPGGVGLPPISLLYVPSDERVCQALARMWEQELGVQMTLQVKDSKAFAEDKANHRFMIARGNWFADYNDPTTFLDCFVTGNGNNDSGYSNLKYDRLLAEASRTRDSKERMALLRRAETIIIEQDFPILPILHYSSPIAIAPGVQGLHPNARSWYPFQFVTVER